jgi:hypothetical protein
MGDHRFRRVREDDGTLAEEVVFTVDEGRVTRFEHHNNYFPKMK